MPRPVAHSHTPKEHSRLRQPTPRGRLPRVGRLASDGTSGSRQPRRSHGRASLPLSATHAVCSTNHITSALPPPTAMPNSPQPCPWWRGMEAAGSPGGRRPDPARLSLVASATRRPSASVQHPGVSRRRCPGGGPGYTTASVPGDVDPTSGRCREVSRSDSGDKPSASQ